MMQIFQYLQGLHLFIGNFGGDISVEDLIEEWDIQFDSLFTEENAWKKKKKKKKKKEKKV